MRKIAFLAGISGPLSPEQKRRREFLTSVATIGTQIDMYGSKESIDSRIEEKPYREKKDRTIESTYDEYMGVPEEAALAIQAEQDGYDAIIISCGNDPGLEVLREVVKIPVIGPGDAGMHMCSMIGHRFCRLVTYRPGRHKLSLNDFEKYNGLMKWISSRSIGLTTTELKMYPEKAYEACLNTGKIALEEDQVDAITWSCSSLSFIFDLDRRLMNDLKIPVINPMKAAVRMAEMCIDFGLKHSKITYPSPDWKYDHKHFDL
jgi:allantoin racemase